MGGAAGAGAGAGSEAAGAGATTASLAGFAGAGAGSGLLGLHPAMANRPANGINDRNNFGVLIVVEIVGNGLTDVCFLNLVRFDLFRMEYLPFCRPRSKSFAGFARDQIDLMRTALALTQFVCDGLTKTVRRSFSKTQRNVERRWRSKS